MINFTKDKNYLAQQRLKAVAGNLQFIGISTLMTRAGDKESTSYWDSFTGWVSDTAESVANSIMSGAEWIEGEVVDVANRTNEYMESNYSSYEMLNQYMSGTGEDYAMRETSWERVSVYAKEKIGTKYNEGSSFTVDDKTYYQCQVSFYDNIDLGAAFGTSTVYFDSNGNPAGFKDTYNFDSKPWGERTVVGELSTRIGDELPGESYDIKYGVQKPK